MKTCPIPVKRLGRRLRRFLYRPEVFTILPVGDWTHGGCWILAQTLAKRIPGARMRGVWDHGFLHHAVVEVDGCYLDGDGAHTERQLLRNMKRYSYVDNPRLGPWDPKDAKRRGILCPVVSRRKLDRALREIL